VTRRGVINLIDVRLHSGSFSLMHFLFGSSGTVFNEYLTIGVIIDPGSRGGSIGIPPITGPPNAIGDKSCLHYNWRGTLHALPVGAFTTRTVKQGDVSLPCRYIGTSYLTTYQYLALCEFGESGSLSASKEITVAGKPFHATWDASWEWVGDRYLILHIVQVDGNAPWRTRYFSRVIEFKYNLRTKHYDVRWKDEHHAKSEYDGFIDNYPTGNFSAATYYNVAGTVSPTETIMDDILKSLKSVSTRVDQSLPPVGREVWGDLADLAVQNAKSLDINSLAYAYEFLMLKDTVKSMLSILRGNPSPKKLAQAWLSFRYGLRLTFSDSSELGRAIGKYVTKDRSKKNYSVCRARDSSMFITRKQPFLGLPVFDQYNLKVYYRPDSDAFLNACRILMNWDAFPTLQNVWDLIPLSFVIDWFTDFERTLNRIDTNTYINTLDVLGTIRTRKSTIRSIEGSLLNLPSGYDWSGFAELDVYKRNLVPTLDLPLYRSGSPDEFHNIVDLTAIILARRR